MDLDGFWWLVMTSVLGGWSSWDPVGWGSGGETEETWEHPSRPDRGLWWQAQGPQRSQGPIRCWAQNEGRLVLHHSGHEHSRFHAESIVSPITMVIWCVYVGCNLPMFEQTQTNIVDQIQPYPTPLCVAFWTGHRPDDRTEHQSADNAHSGHFRSLMSYVWSFQFFNLRLGFREALSWYEEKSLVVDGALEPFLNHIRQMSADVGSSTVTVVDWCRLMSDGLLGVDGGWPWGSACLGADAGRAPWISLDLQRTLVNWSMLG